MRHAGLLHHAVPRAERHLRARHDERDLPAEHGHVVQRLRRVRVLKALGLLADVAATASSLAASPGAISTILKQAPPGAGSRSHGLVDGSDLVTSGGVRSLTQTSVVRYRPAWITVGGSPW